MSSEKRFILFLATSMLILMATMLIQRQLFPPPPPAVQNDAEQGGAEQGGAEQGGEAPDGDDEGQPGDREPQLRADNNGADQPQADEPTDGPEPGVAPERVRFPAKRIALGSMAPNSPFRLLAVINSQGAAIEQVELVERNRQGDFLYREIYERGGHVYDRSGYLGYLAVTDLPTGDGCLINVVPDGSPAATAQSTGSVAGLQPGDQLLAIDGQEIHSVDQYKAHLRTTRPEQQVQLQVRRAEQVLSFTTTLVGYPLAVIRPEDASNLSCLLTLADAKAIRNQRANIATVSALRDNHWMHDQEESDRISRESGNPCAVFRYLLFGDELEPIGQKGSWEIIKRYQLVRVDQQQQDDPNYPAYHLQMDIELRNTGAESAFVALQLEGPNGLPTEGWWYSNKVHPSSFSSVGARDIAWKTVDGGYQLTGCPAIYNHARKNAESPETILVDRNSDQLLGFAGVDTQYFSSVLIPSDAESAAMIRLSQLAAKTVVPIPPDSSKYDLRKTNVTFSMQTEPVNIAAGGVYQRSFKLFAGPKRPELLYHYGLSPLIAYGWFWWVAIPLSHILHFIHYFVWNYGIAIILLTVLVRGGMFPISRKAAKNAQTMQDLAPELKKLTEKYKNDMEKRAQAQRELFAKHNYNPLGGCLLMLLQLPIFVGLYRSLSVDILLRDASLIPGIRWCSNLAGPDMFWYWEPYLPGFFVDPGRGWLGPYLNVLPLVTIALFIVHQKLFMPPPTDEQSRMQQQMMKYMMIFMGVMFFKVPAGLCIYFVASSLWGIGERKLIPPLAKPGTGSADKAPKVPASPAPTSSNGSGAKGRQRRKSKGRR